MGNRRNVWFLTLATLFQFSALYVYWPFLPLHARSLGASAVSLGVVVAAQWVLPLLLAVAAGSLGDRLGYRRTTVSGLALMLVSRAGLLWASSIPLLAFWQMLSGLGDLVATVAQQAMVASSGNLEQRKRAFGWYTVVTSAGSLVGPLLGGAAVKLYGYPAIYLLSVVLSGLALGCAFLLTEPAPAPVVPVPQAPASAAGPPAAATPRSVAAALSLARDPLILFAFTITACIVIAMSVRETFLPVLLDELGHSPTTIGFLVSLRPLITLAARPLLNMFRDRRGMAVGTVLVTLASGVAVAASPALTGSVGLLGLVAVLEGIGFGVGLPLAMVLAAGRAPQAEGLVVGLRITANRLTRVLLPLVLGVVLHFAGHPAVFWVSGGMMVALAGYAFRLVQRASTAGALGGADPAAVS